jgi:hypothetical protein
MGVSRRDRNNGSDSDNKRGENMMQIMQIQGIVRGVVQKLTSPFRNLISRFHPEPEVKYITEYIPYKGMDYYAILICAIGFGLCAVILAMKYRNLVKEINTHQAKHNRGKK